MAARLSVIFYIILCLEIGIALALLPWIPEGTLGWSDWGHNYFLLYAAQKTGLHGLQHAVSSGWVRGAVTGVGLLNIFVAVWEMVHFKQSVRALQGNAAHAPVKDVAQTTKSADVSHHERRDDAPDPSAE